MWLLAGIWIGMGISRIYNPPLVVEDVSNLVVHKHALYCFLLDAKEVNYTYQLYIKTGLVCGYRYEIDVLQYYYKLSAEDAFQLIGHSARKCISMDLYKVYPDDLVKLFPRDAGFIRSDSFRADLHKLVESQPLPQEFYPKWFPFSEVLNTNSLNSLMVTGLTAFGQVTINKYREKYKKK